MSALGEIATHAVFFPSSQAFKEILSHPLIFLTDLNVYDLSQFALAPPVGQKKPSQKRECS